MKNQFLILTIWCAVFVGCAFKKKEPATISQASPSGSEDSTAAKKNGLVTAKNSDKVYTNVALRQCLRPAHYRGLKKCLRQGFWVKMQLSSNDVDNDRTDVFTEPSMTLNKENFYLDTFRMEQGKNHIYNYPDIFKVSSAYGGIAQFIFAMPSNNDLRLNFSYSGRDESYSKSTNLDEISKPNNRYVKIQHWNDRSTYKKFAKLDFQILGTYSELKYRNECSWMETDTGLDFSQPISSDGIHNMKIPETIIWRKITEKCEALNALSSSDTHRLHLFSDVNNEFASVAHSFKNESKSQRLIFTKEKVTADTDNHSFSLLDPLNYFKVKLDGSMVSVKTENNEEVIRIEGIYEEDLKDKSFFPQKEISSSK